MGLPFKPFTNAAGQLRNGWWIAISMLVLAGIVWVASAI
jgi:hypothetical protein